MTKKLLKLVKENRFLYDPTHTRFHNKKYRRNFEIYRVKVRTTRFVI